VTFTDLADGGRALAPLIEPLLTPGTVVVSAGVGGLVTGAAVADRLRVEVTPLRTTRSEAGVTVEVPLVVQGLRVVVVDDGVETGTAARAVAAALREAGAVHLVLAVPVCPREAEADLRTRFDGIVAVERPLVRRSLRWHYETFA
jgi:predicted phosphoribosyltransferase